MKTTGKNRLKRLVLCAAAAALCLQLETCKTMPQAAPEDTFLERVYLKLAGGDMEGALDLFKQLDPADAEKSSYLLTKASILFSAGRLAEGRAVAAAAVNNAENMRETVEAQFIISNIDGAEGKRAAQKAMLDGIYKSDPLFVPGLNALGSFLLSAKQVKQARFYYESALKVEPANMDALIGIAAVFRLERKPREAIRRLTEAVALYPKDPEPLAQRGRLRRETGDLNAALADLDAAQKIAPEDYWIAYDRGRTLLALDKKRDALGEFKRAEKINPAIFVSYVYSAGIYDEINDRESALRDYETLVNLKPDYYFGLEMLGIHYMREKRYAAARDAFRSAYAKAPENPDYALLTVINSLYSGDKQPSLKPYIEAAMKPLDRASAEYTLLRLFYEFAGDSDVVRKTSTEKNLITKSKNLFYLANYYELRGMGTLAQKLFDEFKGLQRKETMEWRIYEFAGETGALSLAPSAAGKEKS